MRAGVLHEAFRRLPLGTPDQALPGTTLLLAPHPDDESIGCGGLIAALCAAGRPPVLAVLTDGVGSHPNSAAWPAPRLRRRRREETTRAAALLGLPADRLLFLDLPDTRAPHGGPDFEAAVSALDAIAAAHGCASVLTSWEHDPHCDHESAWRIGRALARRRGMALLAYPVWGWTLDAETELPATDAPAGWRIDVAAFLPAKAAAIAAHETQHGALITDDPDGFVLPRQLLSAFEGRYETVLRFPPEASWGREVFDRLYAADPDPWRFDSSPYEAAKYADTLASLGDRRFHRGLELGCSNGAMTDRLAVRCDALHAVDISPAAIALARDRCERHRHVVFHVAALPSGFAALPPGPYDAVVISELLYFLCGDDIDALAARLAPALAGDATVVLVNWTGPTDTPSTGDEAAERLIRALLSHRRFDVSGERRQHYRLDRLLRRVDAVDAGPAADVDGRR